MDNNSFLNIVIAGLLSVAVSLITAYIKISKYIQIVDDLKKDVEKMNVEIKQMSKEITVCFTKIEERTQSLVTTLTKKKSPISLTETGQNILKRSGSDAFVLNNKDELVGKIKSGNPKSAYDVQENARKVVESFAQDERFIPFKDFVFKEGIELEAIFIVMSIYLRDVALPLLGYKPEDIDISASK